MFRSGKLLRLVRQISHLRYGFSQQKRVPIEEIPDLQDFMRKQMQEQQFSSTQADTTDDPESQKSQRIKFTIETYGCQMNHNDSEIINSIMKKAGYQYVKDSEDPDIIFLNTCAIREKAESKIWSRLQEIKTEKRKSDNKTLVTGVLGCMAERLKDKLAEKNSVVDVIAGPDTYRDLPNLLDIVYRKQNGKITPYSSEGNNEEKFAMNVQLSMDETYADVDPVRINPESPQAYVSIMRGCNNMCSFCIVPFTRGRERSRNFESILREVAELDKQGVKEIVLLGQNVNSYLDESSQEYYEKHENSEGFKELFKLRDKQGLRFASLLEKVAQAAPETRIRFTSPHPKDFPDSVLEVIKKYPNICKNIHMPAQSGNTEILAKMRRNYTREAYINLINKIRQQIPGITFSSDFICGFCGETEEQFLDTLSLLEYVKYEQAFLFAYSMREKTHAHRRMEDDVPEDVKMMRVQRMNQVFLSGQEQKTRLEKGNIHLLLVDGHGKFKNQLKGRTDTNRIAILDSVDSLGEIPEITQQNEPELKSLLHSNNLPKLSENLKNLNNSRTPIKIGDFVVAYVKDTTKRSLICQPLFKSTISQFSRLSDNQPFITPSIDVNFQK